MVLDALERMHAHLTAAVVSNDLLFLQARDCDYIFISDVNVKLNFILHAPANVAQTVTWKFYLRLCSTSY